MPSSPFARRVVAGSLYQGTSRCALLVCFKPDGSLDDSFGQGGVVTNYFNEGGLGNALAIQPDGKIVLAGQADVDLNSNFSALGTVTANGAGLWQYDDAGAVGFPRRFYRLAFP